MSIRVGLRGMARKPKFKWVRRMLANIFLTHSLCTTEFEELTAQPTLSYVLCIEQKEYLVASPALTYSLTVT